MNNVLIASPISEKHNSLLDSYVEQFFGFQYPKKHLLLVEAGEFDDQGYYKFLKTKLDKYTTITILKGPWFEHALERIAYARNIIRQFASNYGFSHILFLDTDTFIPNDSIWKLLKHEKDLVGFVCFSKTRKGNKQVIAMKSGNLLIMKHADTGESVKTLDYYSNEEIMSQVPNLIKVYSTAMSPLLVSKRVFEKTPFRYIISHPIGEDVAWHIENNDNGFEYYMDTSVVADHRQTGWNGLVK